MIPFFEGQQCVEYGTGERQDNEGARLGVRPLPSGGGRGDSTLPSFDAARPGAKTTRMTVNHLTWRRLSECGSNSILPYAVSGGTDRRQLPRNMGATRPPFAKLLFWKEGATRSIRMVARDVTVCRRDKGNGVSCDSEELTSSPPKPNGYRWRFLR
jgi:hypothetical protein